MANYDLSKFVRNISDTFKSDPSDENETYCDCVVGVVQDLVKTGSIIISNQPGYDKAVKSYWNSGKPATYDSSYEGKAAYMRDVVAYAETGNDQELILEAVIDELDLLLQNPLQHPLEPAKVGLQVSQRSNKGI